MQWKGAQLYGIEKGQEIILSQSKGSLSFNFDILFIAIFSPTLNWLVCTIPKLKANVNNEARKIEKIIQI